MPIEAEVVKRKARDCLHIHQNSKNLVVTENRISKFAEVYTPVQGCEFIVNNVEYAIGKYFIPQNVKIEQLRFWVYADTIEPFIGSGNIIESALISKIKCAFKLARECNIDLKQLRNTSDLAYWLICIINSLAGIDIQEDNVKVSRARMYFIVNKVYKRVYGKYIPLSLARIFAYLLKLKIIHRDTFRADYYFYLGEITPDLIVKYNFIYDDSLVAKYIDKSGEHIRYAKTCFYFKPRLEKFKTDKSKNAYIMEHCPELMQIDINNPPADNERIPFETNLSKIKDIYNYYNNL